eukprot:SAG31_NODE_2404_length_5763_cov_6.902560_3_plen_414_part_00
MPTFQGGQDHLVIQLAGFSEGLQRPIVVTVDNGVVGKSGSNTAETVFHHLQELGCLCGGQMTDSAASAIDGQSTALSEHLDGRWLAVGGCTIHVHNLTLEVPYTKVRSIGVGQVSLHVCRCERSRLLAVKVFGPANLGKPSVLMLLRTISWLQQRYFSVETAVASNIESLVYPQRMISEAVLTRWHTVSSALKYWHAHANALAHICSVMHDGLLPTQAKTREMYGTVGCWLTKADKLKVDMFFMLDFCEHVWDPRYYNLTKVDDDHKVSGFRSRVIGRSYVDYAEKLARLSSDGWKAGDEFHRYRVALADLASDVDAQNASTQQVLNIGAKFQNDPECEANAHANMPNDVAVVCSHCVWTGECFLGGVAEGAATALKPLARQLHRDGPAPDRQRAGVLQPRPRCQSIRHCRYD